MVSRQTAARPCPHRREGRRRTVVLPEGVVRPAHGGRMQIQAGQHFQEGEEWMWDFSAFLCPLQVIGTDFRAHRAQPTTHNSWQQHSSNDFSLLGSHSFINVFSHFSFADPCHCQSLFLLPNANPSSRRRKLLRKKLEEMKCLL